MSSDKFMDDQAAVKDWHNVGVHPTPDEMAEKFGLYVANLLGEAKVTVRSLKAISILDACSGDGRLGHAIARRLVDIGHSVSVTFVEVDATTAALIARSDKYAVKIINKNVFTYDFSENFDLVVSNPPYRAINCADATKFGFEWSEVSAAGRNLYGLAIKRCIDICKVKGFVAVIAPHGWLRNDMAKSLRKFVASSCSSLHINAFSKRTLFPGVNQDTSFQFAVVDKPKSSDRKRTSLDVQLQFDDGGEEKLSLLSNKAASGSVADALRVRVGPFVWNREQELLQERPEDGVVVINGANIQQDGTLCLNSPGYVKRQFVKKDGLPENHLTKAPFIVIKRTMRGKPGAWIVDSALIRKRGFLCVAENHSIVVECVTKSVQKHMPKIQKKLSELIEQLHRFHGHPNISVRLARAAVNSLLKKEIRKEAALAAKNS